MTVKRADHLRPLGYVRRNRKHGAIGPWGARRHRNAEAALRQMRRHQQKKAPGNQTRIRLPLNSQRNTYYCAAERAS